MLAATDGPERWPTHRTPEVAFAGRSNVGKSSLLNALLGKKTISRVSSTPGRTRQLLFFAVSARLCLVDLPGYGYARRSKSERQNWGAQIENYLERRENLALVIALIDARHGATELDQMMLAYLEGLGQPFLVALTKVDKLPPSRRKRIIEAHTAALPAPAQRSRLLVSATTGEGIEELRRQIEKAGKS